MKGKMFKAIYMAVLVSFSTYVLSDTFLLTRTYASAQNSEVNTSGISAISANETSYQKTSSTGTPETGTASVQTSGGTSSVDLSSWSDVRTVGTYNSDNYSVTVYSFRDNNTTVYAADVSVNSVSNLRSAFANETYGRNVTEKTSSMAQDVSAVLAINGDYYGARQSGIVIRNGKLYRDTYSSGDEILCLYKTGEMKVVKASEVSAEDLVSQGVWQAWSFGPGLTDNGQITVSQNEEVGKAMASNPRTAIGMIDKGHYVFVVSDGRTSESTGLSLYQLAQVIQKLGATVSYNLDGGGSSTMVFKGQVINNPTTNGRISERSVSDMIYIGD